MELWPEEVSKNQGRVGGTVAPAIGGDPPHPSPIVARSAAMQAALQRAEKIASTAMSVLLLGESGTGKEVIARYIHMHSRRGAFVAVNCAALPDPLMESELFGHMRGSFTGAFVDRQGLFQGAHGGTLLLDEIGELSLALQAKLLRVLEERRVRPLGSVREYAIDARIISATNRDLKDMVTAGAFRADLYYRLRVAEIALPPLRERTEDILPLVHGCVDAVCAREGSPPCALDPELCAMLLAYPWPGNIRELRHAVEFAVLTAGPGQDVFARHLPEEVRHPELHVTSAGIEALAEAFATAERQYLVALLKRSGGKHAPAARTLGISAGALHRRLLKYGIV